MRAVSKDLTSKEDEDMDTVVFEEVSKYNLKHKLIDPDDRIYLVGEDTQEMAGDTENNSAHEDKAEKLSLIHNRRCRRRG